MKLSPPPRSRSSLAAIAAHRRPLNMAARPPPPAADADRAAAGAAAGRSSDGQRRAVKPSSKALKALVELQNAVNANDVANIPAKVAAAQAVATTKEDRYLIGQLQLKAALAAKDNAAMAAAVDAIAASGYRRSGAGRASSTQRSAASSTTPSNIDQAAAAFQKRRGARSQQHRSLLDLLGEAQFAQGRKAEAVGAFQRAIQAEQRRRPEARREAVQARGRRRL